MGDGGPPTPVCSGSGHGPLSGSGLCPFSLPEDEAVSTHRPLHGQGRRPAPRTVGRIALTCGSPLRSIKMCTVTRRPPSSTLGLSFPFTSPSAWDGVLKAGGAGRAGSAVPEDVGVSAGRLGGAASREGVWAPGRLWPGGSLSADHPPASLGAPGPGAEGGHTVVLTESRTWVPSCPSPGRSKRPVAAAGSLLGVLLSVSPVPARLVTTSNVWRNVSS